MKQETKTYIKQLLLRLLLIVVVFASIAIVTYIIMRATGITSIEHLQSIANTWYIYLIVVALQIVQVVFIPVSNQLVTIPAIAVLGLWPAFLCSYIGIEIGTVILYIIGRFASHKFIVWLAGDQAKADKLTHLLQTRRLFYPVGMLIGVIPDDLLTTLAGMARYNFWYVLIVSAITRAICVFVTCISFGYLIHTWWGLIIVIVGIILLIALSYITLRYGDKIEQKLFKGDKNGSNDS